MIPLTLTFTPSLIRREAITYTTVTDYGTSFQLFNHMRRPAYRFTLTYDAISRAHMHVLEGFHAAHQGGMPFYWDGGEFGAVENYVFIATADGKTTSYYLPNRGIFNTSSFSARIKNVNTLTTSVTGDYFIRSTGEILFTVTPTSGQEIEARWSCYYLLNYDPNSLKMEQVARNVYRAEFQLTESGLVSF